MRKKIFIAILLFFLAGVIAIISIGAYYFIIQKIRADKAIDQDVKLQKIVSDIKEKHANVADEGDRNMLINNDIYEKALMANDANLCFEIAKEFQNECILSIARKLKNKNLCNQITDDNFRVNCQQEIILIQALENKDISSCFELASESVAYSCFSQIIDKGIARADCEKIPLGKYHSISLGNKEELRSVCISSVMSQEAIDLNDLELCKQVPLSHIRAVCFSNLLKTDPLSDKDNDGLVFFNEVYLGTDPDNPDSDNDGFLDGKEVENKYNPLSHDPNQIDIVE